MNEMNIFYSDECDDYDDFDEYDDCGYDEFHEDDADVDES